MRVTFARRTLFLLADVERDSLRNLGSFDVVLALGIFYHLSDPIGVMARLATLDAPVIVIDSHVHYSVDANEEDFPRWWMLRDTDLGLTDGVFPNLMDVRDQVDHYATRF